MLTVSVISPEAVLFEGTTDSVVAPAYDGQVGILTGHAPMVTLLGKGELRLGGAGQRFNVDGGSFRWWITWCASSPSTRSRCSDQASGGKTRNAFPLADRYARKPRRSVVRTDSIWSPSARVTSAASAKSIGTFA